MKTSRFPSTFIVKVTENCNLSCLYCYEQNRNKSIIDVNYIEELFKSIQTDGQKVTQIIWHGGEPFLVGLDFYKEIINIQDYYIHPNKKIIHSIQTNGTLINEENINFFIENKFGIGISFDGPEIIQNYQRPVKGKQNSFNLILKSIDILRNKNYPISISCVITSKSILYFKELLDFFVDNKINLIDFLPCLEYSNNKKSLNLFVDPIEYSSFLINVYDYWIKSNNRKLRIRILENIIQSFLVGYSDLCKLSGTCNQFITMATNGNILPCDSFGSNEDFIIGNLNNDKLIDLINSDKHSQLITKYKNNYCEQCKWNLVCNGGCVYHNYLQVQNKNNLFCESNEKLFSYIRNDLIERGYKILF